MLLNERDLKEMIFSAVKNIITEKMHVIDEKLFPLAEFIYDKIDKDIRNGINSIEFRISKEEITEFYPYSNPCDLKIICGLGVTSKKMQYKDQTLLINVESFYVVNKRHCISRIIHELTHFVNDNEGEIGKVFITNDSSTISTILNRLTYFLRDTEQNARCSEFGYELQTSDEIKEVKYYEDITHLNEIERLLNKLTELDSYHSKQVNRFNKRYSNYKKKIYKIYYYFLSAKSFK